MAARAALKGETRQSSPMSATTPPSVTIASSVSTNGTRSTSRMSSLTQESTRYKKHGVTFNEFIVGTGLDWRKFECITYDWRKIGVMKGIVQVLEERRAQFNRNTGCA